MSLSQMQVFNQYFMPATIETLAQLVDKFNAASGGAIRLTTEGFDGDFMQESFYAAIHSARRRVDRYASNADASPTDLTQIKHSSVKVAGGFGPVRYEPSQMTWLNKPTAEGIELHFPEGQFGRERRSVTVPWAAVRDLIAPVFLPIAE